LLRPEFENALNSNSCLFDFHGVYCAHEHAAHGYRPRCGKDPSGIAAASRFRAAIRACAFFEPDGYAPFQESNPQGKLGRFRAGKSAVFLVVALR
jgi:hypothetical protein